MFTRDEAHGLVERPVDDLPLVSGRRPQLIVRALAGLNKLAHVSHVDEHLVCAPEVANQARRHDAWVHRHGGDVGVSPRKLRRVEDIGQLALTVADPGAEPAKVLRGAKLVELDTTLGMAAKAHGGENHNADVRALGGAEERGHEGFDEHSVTDVIGAKLDFEAVRGQARRLGHDAHFADEVVEALRWEFGDDGLDGGE